MKLLLCHCLLLGGLFKLVLLPAEADQIKANNNSNLELAGSWVSGVAPAGNDKAIWDSTVATASNCTNTLGAAVAWSSIVVSNPVAPVYISGNTTLTLSNGISLANATVNLTVDCTALNLGANQTWSVASGRTLTTGAAGHPGSVNSPNNGNFIVTKSGGGIWTSSGNGDNGSSGIIVNQGIVNLNKTSSSGTHCIGGPGLTVNSGGLAKITGTGGDQIYDGATVSLASGATFDLNGNSETIGNLTGSGTVDNTAAGTSATLTIGSGNNTFGGSLQNSGVGAKLGLAKSGTGTFTLSGTNSYAGGTTISGGTLSLTTTANVTMAYTNNSGGTLSVTAANTTSSLPMSNLTFGNGTSGLTFNLGGLRNLTVPLVNVSGNLLMSGNVSINAVNITQSGTNVLLQYSGARSGSGSFVAGTLPVGATITDDVVNKRVLLVYTSLNQPRLIIPTLNTNEIVVAVATPQQYGAVGDGITDDSGAFQAAMNAVFNSGGSGGGVVFVPVGNYAFYTNLTIPTGVTLHGDWQDWTKGDTGLVGTTFKIYSGAGQSNGTPFITLNGSTALRDVNFWYPNQNANNITSYPFTIGLGSDCVVQNVVLVNSYQGIETFNGGDKHILSTVIGTPLYKGIDLDQIFDVCHAEDIRFSPNVWPASGLTNAPLIGGTYATWMRNNGEGMRLRRVDGEMCMDTYISGYNVGIEANANTNGQPGATFYSGSVSNCAVSLLAQDMPSAFGLMFANFTLDGDIAVNRTNTADDANALFDHCQIIGRNGIAVSAMGSDWHSWMQFQNCTISNALQLTGPGVFNVVDSALLGSTQCILAASATRAAFTGCVFGSPTNILNFGNASNLLIDAHQSISNAFPMVYWTNVANDFLSRKPASTNLYVVTDVAWGAYGDGIHDDTVAIQNALTAAASGGGIVYLPAGEYHLTNTLDVPAGVQIHGAFEMRHGTVPGQDGFAKGTILQPYGGYGTTNGPPAVALEPGAGLVGVTISYESQNTNCIPFPPAIQGRGGNIYAIGVCCPNPYYYIDLDSYTCTNHFIDMADGWALKTGYHIGNGSSGTIVDCHCNWTYWIENGDSQSTLPPPIQAPVLSFASHYLKMYVLGNCTELMVKDFSIVENNYVDCVAEAGQGPNATLINNYCDATIQGFILDSAAPSTINAVNTPMTTFNFGGYADQAQSTVAVLSTTNFQGVARFIGSVLWGGTYLDFVVNGGDVGFDMAHMDSHSFIGSIANGGIFHLVNNSAYSASGGPSNFPPYSVTFGVNAGVIGKTNEFVGCFAYNGCSLVDLATNNPVNCWNDYALCSYAVLDPTQPIIYNLYPNGTSLYQNTSLLSFTVLSPVGISSGNVNVTVDGNIQTNLSFSGPATSLNVIFPGLTLNRVHTAAISIIDNNGRVAARSASFDTFNPDSYAFEAEDFDYGGGKYFDNPQHGAYAGLGGVDEIDYHSASAGQGNEAYRPNPPGLETESCRDQPRLAFSPGLQDYDVGFNVNGNWGNYTRTYPAGTYNVYLRGSDGIGAVSDSASFAIVTSGQTTTNQTISKLGTFSVPATGDWQTYAWVPLNNASGNLVQVTNSGAVSTFRISTDNGSYNANFYILIPTYAPPTNVALTVSNSGANGGLSISFPTQPGYDYQVQYKTNLTDAAWIPLVNAISGDGTIHLVNDVIGTGSRFYRVQIQ
jgi:autotransporter-associated beta strand protein